MCIAGGEICFATMDGSGAHEESIMARNLRSETEEILNENIDKSYGFTCILMFSGCQMASGTLSEKEITVFNTEFFNGDITNMNNMLLSSEYSQPDEINLFELFYNGVGGAFGEVSEDELSMLTELCSDAPYLDIIKITANEMDAFLQEKMGISLAETKKTGLDSFYYLEQYDSYYLIMGDSNFDWCMVTSGTWESNNKLILKYEKEYEGGQWVVILQKTDDGYLFISNQKAD